MVTVIVKHNLWLINIKFNIFFFFDLFLPDIVEAALWMVAESLID